ncbi:MAG: hypothetical protein BGO41_05485 [Clostridiales bacterium 38-18]|nr:MAG: hypothetical protein BGO41_05485 [Clostridiales bacterium 38-18]
MRISKRDRLLLIVLAFVAAFALYYFLLMHPKEESISNLETSFSQWESMKSDVDAKLTSEKILDKNIEDLKDQIRSASLPLYEEITQEEIVALLSRFAEGSFLNISEMQSSPNLSTSEGIMRYQTTLSFKGNYDDLLGYIRTIRNNDKHIILNSVIITNNLQDELTGKMVLEFNAITNAKEYISESEKLVSKELNTRDVLMGPFLPYESFVINEAPGTTDTVNPEYPQYPDTTDELNYEDYNPKTQIYSFEEGDFFFVANSEDIQGGLTRSKTKISDGYSAEMSFDFMASRPYSEANLVFDQNKVMLTKQVDTIGLWVYAYEASNHKLGVVILDSKGKEFRVELANAVDWTQWNELEVQMPVEITYPCMIQRIYVEGIGYDQKLTGKYLMDQLEVSYPVN